jgi:cell division protein FtsL
LVLAKQKAAGAEYLFDYQYGLPQKKKRTVIRRRTKTSPVYKVIAGFLLLSCFFITALAYTYVKARITYLNWELNQVKQENIAICANMEKTKLEIAGLKSPDRIRYLAVSELGMTESPRIEYLVMNNVFAEEKENKANTSQKSEEQGAQLASGKTKNKILKSICEVIAFQGMMGKG